MVRDSLYHIFFLDRLSFMSPNPFPKTAFYGIDLRFGSSAHPLRPCVRENRLSSFSKKGTISSRFGSIHGVQSKSEWHHRGSNKSAMAQAWKISLLRQDATLCFHLSAEKGKCLDSDRRLAPSESWAHFAGWTWCYNRWSPLRSVQRIWSIQSLERILHSQLSLLISTADNNSDGDNNDGDNTDNEDLPDFQGDTEARALCFRDVLLRLIFSAKVFFNQVWAIRLHLCFTRTHEQLSK